MIDVSLGFAPIQAMIPVHLAQCCGTFSKWVRVKLREEGHQRTKSAIPHPTRSGSKTLNGKERNILVPGEVNPCGTGTVLQDFLCLLGALLHGSPLPNLYTHQNSAVVNYFIFRFSSAWKRELQILGSSILVI